MRAGQAHNPSIGVIDHVTVASTAGVGGIDGVISLDKLGLKKVYVQAKRWQGTVGSPRLQAFYGALAEQKAKRGVFIITTSGFSAQAIDFSRSRGHGAG